MAGMSASQVQAELQRKKSLGIAPTSAANTAQYKTLKATTPVAATPKPTTGGVVPPTTPRPVAPVATTPQAARPNTGGVVPQLNAATNTKGATPSLGYGGTSYGSSAAASRGIAANQTALKNTPGFKESEIARTQAVIEQRKAQGLDTSAQEKYLNVNLGFGQQVPMPNMPMATGYAGQTGLINDIYDNQYQSQLQALKKQRDIALQGLNSQETTAKQSAYDNRNQADTTNLQNEQRMREMMANSGLTTDGQNLTLQASQNAQRLGALTGINQQEANALQDLSQQRSLINNNASADDLALLQQIQSNKAGSLLNDAYHGDELALQEGQLLGTYKGQQTLAGQAQNWGQTVDRANLTGNFNGQKTAQQAQQDWQNRFAYGNAIGQFSNGQQTLENKQFQYTQGRDKVADQQWQQEFDRIKEQDGIQNAISWASQNLNERQENRIASNQSSSGSESSKSSSGATSTDDEEFDPNMPLTMSDMYKYINGKLPQALQTYGPSNRNDLIERMILSNPNLSDKDIFKLYQKFGLKVPEQ